ncbi:MAG: DUF4010 domain-containing protein, partial [Caldilineaceae bacterium]|nr:DUF4010 domain-containing protein [Caldilineaceae bacterium]
IVLPILPNRGYGPAPFDVLNPYRIWLMVVLISGISFFGYVLIKLLPGHSGVGVTGLLGGLVSSTAVTVSFAQRSRQMASLARPFAFAVVIAWTVMFLRTPIEIAVVNPDLLGGVWPPMTAATAAMIVYAGIMYYSDRRAIQGDLSFSNPFELRPAIAFGFLYALILVVARAAQIYFGEWGIYLSAVFGGIADVNAVTLSVAELNRTGNLQATTAVQAVVLAAVSNTVVKAVIVAVVGSGAMLRAVILAVPVGIAGALVALWFF